jgi:hypothetical protein
VSQLAVGCPLAEADLCDQLGSHPVHALHRQALRVSDLGDRLLEGAEESRESGGRSARVSAKSWLAGSRVTRC